MHDANSIEDPMPVFASKYNQIVAKKPTTRSYNWQSAIFAKV